MRTYKIDTFIPQGIRSGGRYTTRFGGQPDWIAAPPMAGYGYLKQLKAEKWTPRNLSN